MFIVRQKNFFWTKHAGEKMRYYRLSESRLKRIYRFPQRVEDGIAEHTLAAMQSEKNAKHPYEVWIMYQIKNDTVKIISAWRYPGISEAGKRVPVPTDILEELKINY